MCCILSGAGLHAEIRQVKFRKDRVKMQIWGKPAIFSHEVCLYITSFHSAARVSITFERAY